jgi:hypothetical protein
MLVARAVFGLAFVGIHVTRWPVPWYFPIEHRWEVASRPAGIAMGWFGATGAALGAATAAALLTWLSSARGPLARALARTAIVLALARAGGLVLLVDFGYFGWTALHQTARPWAEPACPRGP